MPTYNSGSDYEKAWQQSSHRVNHELQLAQGFNVADIYLNRTYLWFMTLAVEHLTLLL